jgi:hypothetical protein
MQLKGATMELLYDHVVENIGGLWINPVTGNTWLFCIPRAFHTEQIVVLKQRGPTMPLRFTYSLVYLDGTISLKMDGIAYEIIELTATRLVIKIDEETSVELYKETFDAN